MRQIDYATIFEKPDHPLEIARWRLLMSIMAVRPENLLAMLSVSLGITLTSGSSNVPSLMYVSIQSGLDIVAWQMFLVMGGLGMMGSINRFPVASLFGLLPMIVFIMFTVSYFTQGGVWQYQAVLYISTVVMAVLVLVRSIIIYAIIQIIGSQNKRIRELEFENARLSDSLINSDTAGAGIDPNTSSATVIT